MKTVPKNHPRYQSLVTRNQLASALKQGIVHQTGLIAHGRGEAFDYLFGECTIPQAMQAAHVAAAALLSAKHPVLSVNGNVAALCAQSCVDLAAEVPLQLEVNLFHRTETRVQRIVRLLEEHGASHVLGLKPDAVIPGLSHDRAFCSRQGIFRADVVLVPLEDGDRCEALRTMGKTVIAVDLNPLSRTARTATITIVDNVIRALPVLSREIALLKGAPRKELHALVTSWDNEKNLQEVLRFVSKRLNALY